MSWTRDRRSRRFTWLSSILSAISSQTVGPREIPRSWAILRLTVLASRLASAAWVWSACPSAASIHMLSHSARNSSSVALTSDSRSAGCRTSVDHPSDRRSAHKATPPSAAVDHAAHDRPPLLDPQRQLHTLLRRKSPRGDQIVDLGGESVCPSPFGIRAFSFPVHTLPVRPRERLRRREQVLQGRDMAPSAGHRFDGRSMGCRAGVGRFLGPARRPGRNHVLTVDPELRLAVLRRAPWPAM